MPEITREQIEAYRDSPSRLVTEFDRDMARACLAALDRAEAADCEADQLAELVHSLEEQRASVMEERDNARAEVARLRGLLDDWLTGQGAGAEAEVARLVSAERDTRAELEQCMADGRKRTAEAADLRSQLAASGEAREQDKAEIARIKNKLAALVAVFEAVPDITAAAAAWREQVRRELAEAVISLLDEHWPDTIGEATAVVDRIRALAGAGEEASSEQVP